MWVKIKHPTSPAVLVGYVYRNPAATHPWFDDFVQKMDKVCESNPNIVLVGDLNIDLLTSTYPVFCYFFVCFAPTNTLCNKNNSNFCYIAHSYIYIHTNNEQMLSNVRISHISVSDHCPVICTWSCKQPQNITKGHTTVQYRCFKHFDQDVFLWNLSLAPFANVFSFSDPNQALAN